MQDKIKQLEEENASLRNSLDHYIECGCKIMDAIGVGGSLSDSEVIGEVMRLRDIIKTHDLCHDLHGKVGVNEFAEGCVREQRKLFGCAPHADKIATMWYLLGAAGGIIERFGCQLDDITEQKISDWKQAVKNLLGS